MLETRARLRLLTTFYRLTSSRHLSSRDVKSNIEFFTPWETKVFRPRNRSIDKVIILQQKGIEKSEGQLSLNMRLVGSDTWHPSDPLI